MNRINRLKQQQTPENKIGNYLLGKTIGQGTFGKVKLGIHVPTGEKVAIKILVKSKIIDVADVERVSREIHILKLIRHPSIIQLYQIIQTSKYLFLVMEYVEKGELFDYIVKVNKLDQLEACKFYKQIVSGIAYIHELNIVHRDLKPQNLLIDWRDSLKIVDFGLSNTYKSGQLLKTACGSPCYASPEMISSKKYNGLEVDIWSSGVILFAMVCGYLPFQDNNTAQLYKKILSGEYVFPENVSAQFKDLIQKVLNIDPSKRYRISQIYNHPWCKQIQGIPMKSGLIVGYHLIPVDKQILPQLSQYGFDIDYSSRCISANKHNNITTTYYLLLKKASKSGYNSNCDINSSNFDYQSIQPFKRAAFNQKRYLFYATNQQSSFINLNNIQVNLNKKSNNLSLPVEESKYKQTDLNINSHQKIKKKDKTQQKSKFNLSYAQKKKNYKLDMYLRPQKYKFNSQQKLVSIKQNSRSLYDDKSNKKKEYSIAIKTEHSEQRVDSRSKSKYSSSSQKKKINLKVNGLKLK